MLAAQCCGNLGDAIRKLTVGIAERLRRWRRWQFVRLVLFRPAPQESNRVADAGARTIDAATDQLELRDQPVIALQELIAFGPAPHPVAAAGTDNPNGLQQEPELPTIPQCIMVGETYFGTVTSAEGIDGERVVRRNAMRCFAAFAVRDQRGGGAPTASSAEGELTRSRSRA